MALHDSLLGGQPARGRLGLAPVVSGIAMIGMLLSGRPGPVELISVKSATSLAVVSDPGSPLGQLTSAASEVAADAEVAGGALKDAANKAANAAPATHAHHSAEEQAKINKEQLAKLEQQATEQKSAAYKSLQCLGLWAFEPPQGSAVKDACADAAEDGKVFTIVSALALLYASFLFPPVYLFPEATFMAVLSRLLPLVAPESGVAPVLPQLHDGCVVAGGLCVLFRLVKYTSNPKEASSGACCGMGVQLVLAFALYEAVYASVSLA